MFRGFLQGFIFTTYNLFTTLLLASEEKDIDVLNSLDLPSLLDSQNEYRLKPITGEEINASITIPKLGKAVGQDGYNAQWYLPNLINLDQTGLIHHRQTTDNIKRILNIQGQIQKDNPLLGV